LTFDPYEDVDGRRARALIAKRQTRGDFRVAFGSELVDRRFVETKREIDHAVVLENAGGAPRLRVSGAHDRRRGSHRQHRDSRLPTHHADGRATAMPEETVEIISAPARPTR
jgi:hypothetical protein